MTMMLSFGSGILDSSKKNTLLHIEASRVISATGWDMKTTLITSRQWYVNQVFVFSTAVLISLIHCKSLISTFFSFLLWSYRFDCRNLQNEDEGKFFIRYFRALESSSYLPVSKPALKRF